MTLRKTTYLYQEAKCFNLCGNSVATSTIPGYNLPSSAKRQSAVARKKGIDTKQDLTCLWPRQKCVKCPEDFLLGLLDMSPAIICLSFAYCFRKNGGKCHEVPIYSSTNQRRIDICRMWWSLDGSFSQSDSKSNKASSNLIFWNSFVFKYIYGFMYIYIFNVLHVCG